MKSDFQIYYDKFTESIKEIYNEFLSSISIDDKNLLLVEDNFLEYYRENFELFKIISNNFLSFMKTSNKLIIDFHECFDKYYFKDFYTNFLNQNKNIISNHNFANIFFANKKSSFLQKDSLIIYDKLILKKNTNEYNNIYNTFINSTHSNIKTMKFVSDNSLFMNKELIQLLSNKSLYNIDFLSLKNINNLKFNIDNLIINLKELKLNNCRFCPKYIENFSAFQIKKISFVNCGITNSIFKTLLTKLLNSNVEFLSFKKNFISSIFVNLNQEYSLINKLENLDFDSNNFSIFPDDICNKFKNIKYLILNNNNISFISPKILESKKMIIFCLNNPIVNLYNNEKYIQNIFDHLSNTSNNMFLIELNLSSILYKFETILNPNIIFNIKYLDLSHNRLTSKNLEKFLKNNIFYNLKYFVISNNLLDETIFTLNIFNKMINLIYLNLDCNNISNLDGINDIFLFKMNKVYISIRNNNLRKIENLKVYDCKIEK